MKRSLLLSLIFAFVLSASVVSGDRARKVAENYYYNYDKALVPEGSVITKMLTKEYLGQPTWYAFLFTKGFVIVAADDNVNPILGFSFEGSIDDEDINNQQNPFVKRFSFYDRQIVHSIREKKAIRPGKQKEWNDIEDLAFSEKPKDSKDVNNIMTSKWHQGYPFNMNCPSNSPVGSVATAMSQIMYFHRGPSAGTGSYSYTDSWGDITGDHSVNFGSQTYDYELIKDCDYGSSFDTVAKKAEIAKISYHSAVSAWTDFNSDASEAYLDDALYAYENYWGFSTDATYTYHGTISDSSYFSSTIKSDIDNNRPVHWGGGSGETFDLFAESFENTTFPPTGWSITDVSLTEGEWTRVTAGTYPTCSPQSGTAMAKFNSYDAYSGNKTRLTTPQISFAGQSAVSMKFWMYHDNEWNTKAKVLDSGVKSAHYDSVKVYISVNGTDWTLLSGYGRYAATNGWVEHTVDLSSYDGQTVYIGFLGCSDWGNNMFIDNLTISGTTASITTFVISGYYNLSLGGYWYYINWGWGGSYNGWYRINDLAPGNYDFSMYQESITGLYVDGLLTQMPAPSSCTGSVTNGDVTINWGVPPTVNPISSLIDYEIFRDGVLIRQMGGTSTRTWVDHALYEGTFNYTVKAVYQKPDGRSLPSQTYSASVTQNPSYPCPLNVTAKSYLNCRTKIDLTWSKPFVGSVVFQTGFETEAGTWSEPANMYKSSSLTYPPTAWISYPVDANHQGWRIINVSAGYPEWVFQGNQSSFCNGGKNSTVSPYPVINQPYEYMFTPQITSGVAVAVDLYTFTFPGEDIYILTYSGNFTGNPSSQITELAHIVGETEGWNNFKAICPAGTVRVGLVKVVREVNLSIVDNIVIGSDSYPSGDQPSSYQIYNNDYIEATVPCTGLSQTYESTGFDDGLNSYYVRACYADYNYSIASNPTYAWIDANPEPYFLDGTYDAVNDDCDLSWYSPGHFAPHWFGMVFEDDAWDYFDNNDPAGQNYGDEYTKLRTYFDFPEDYFGMTYPIYISELSSAFFEPEEGWWTENRFKIAIGTGYGNDAVYLHTSDWLTAIEDGSWVDYILPDRLTIMEPWFVEVQPYNSLKCTPSMLLSVHKENLAEDPSSFYYEPAADSWWYYSYNSPYEYFDWMILCFGYNDEPTITKDGTHPTSEKIEFGSVKRDSKKSIPVAAIGKPRPKKQDKKIVYARNTKDTKGLDQYQIWRNDERYATVAGNVKTYKDTMPLNSNAYYVTAIYASPEGESIASNKFSIDIAHDPDTPLNITTSIVNGNIKIDWNDSFYASEYNIYSNDSPYGTFLFLDTVTSSEYTYIPTVSKQFFYIKSTNGSKGTAPKKIEIMHGDNQKNK